MTDALAKVRSIARFLEQQTGFSLSGDPVWIPTRLAVALLFEGPHRLRPLVMFSEEFLDDWSEAEIESALAQWHVPEQMTEGKNLLVTNQGASEE